jgi:hypothetical protein
MGFTKRHFCILRILRRIAFPMRRLVSIISAKDAGLPKYIHDPPNLPQFRWMAAAELGEDES